VSQNGIHATNHAHRTNAVKSGVLAFSGAECFPEKLSGKHRGNKGPHREADKDFLSPPDAAIMTCYARERPRRPKHACDQLAQHEVIGNVHRTCPARARLGWAIANLTVNISHSVKKTALRCETKEDWGR